MAESYFRARLFLCLLAYHLEWHMRKRLAPILYGEHDGAAAERAPPSSSPWNPRRRPGASAPLHRSDDGAPVTSLHHLPRHLATLTLNRVTTPLNPDDSFTVAATPADLQRRAFELLGVKPICVQ